MEPHELQQKNEQQTCHFDAKTQGIAHFGAKKIVVCDNLYAHWGSNKEN